MSRSIFALLVISSAAVGCKSAEDREIDASLKTVASNRTAHPHYPIMVFDDFKNENQPAGISVDAYSFYVHETTKSDARSNVLSSTAAISKLEHTFERAVASIKAAEAASPPPKPPYPANQDWLHAPHPKTGIVTIVSRIGSKTRSLDVSVGSSPEMISDIKPALQAYATLVVNDGIKAQGEALKAMATPSGFTLCTEELLKVQQGSRGVEPHLMGGQLYLAPIDRGMAVKGFDRSIRKLLASTAKLKPASNTAHLVVIGPEFSENYPISLDGGEGEEKGLKAALDGLGAKIDELNKKAG